MIEKAFVDNSGARMLLGCRGSWTYWTYWTSRTSWLPLPASLWSGLEGVQYLPVSACVFAGLLVGFSPVDYRSDYLDVV